MAKRAHEVVCRIGMMMAIYLSLIPVSYGNPEAVAQNETPQNTQSTGEFQIYCDFFCPYCARFFRALYAGESVERKRPKLMFRHYPFHDGAELVSQYYEAVRVNYPEQTDEIIESLYKFRKQIRDGSDPEAILSALSTVHGIQFSLIRRDMKARDVMGEVAQSVRDAAAHGVSGTPTVVYSGGDVPPLSPEELARFVLSHSDALVEATPTSSATECPSCQLQK